jgi:O-acetyl-ADP-ribose deacetylase (regulator of RNase III)
MSLTLQLGDITRVDADAIVNAANPQLLPGGGVCGAIHAAAGPELARACAEWVRQHGTVRPGCAAITPGFCLPARHVIHAVGPVWRGGTSGEAEVLAGAYRSSLQLADQHALASIAFPSISTGIYGYPVGLAAPVARSTTRRALARATAVRNATFVLFDAATYRVYERELTKE